MLADARMQARRLMKEISLVMLGRYKKAVAWLESKRWQLECALR
jgi:hypothetical protein